MTFKFTDSIDFHVLSLCVIGSWFDRIESSWPLVLNETLPMLSFYKSHFRECRYMTEFPSEFSLDLMRVTASVNKPYYGRYDPRNDNIYISRGRCRRTILQGRCLMYCCQRVKTQRIFFQKYKVIPLCTKSMYNSTDPTVILQTGETELLLTSANAIIFSHIILCYLYNSQNVRLHWQQKGSKS